MSRTMSATQAHALRIMPQDGKVKAGDWVLRWGGGYLSLHQIHSVAAKTFYVASGWTASGRSPMRGYVVRLLSEAERVAVEQVVEASRKDLHVLAEQVDALKDQMSERRSRADAEMLQVVGLSFTE